MLTREGKLLDHGRVALLSRVLPYRIGNHLMREARLAQRWHGRACRGENVRVCTRGCCGLDGTAHGTLCTWLCVSWGGCHGHSAQQSLQGYVEGMPFLGVKCIINHFSPQLYSFSSFYFSVGVFISSS